MKRLFSFVKFCGFIFRLIIKISFESPHPFSHFLHSLQLDQNNYTLKFNFFSEFNESTEKNLTFLNLA